MIKTNQIKEIRDLDRVFKYPFFKKNIRSKDYYYNKINVLNKNYTPLIDIDKLKDMLYVEKFTDGIREDVLNELLKDKKNELDSLDEEIKTKSEELLTLPSILDEKIYEIPKIYETETKVFEKIGYLHWWEKLGLYDDPFYSLEGLYKIDTELYEQIIHKTEIFNKYESLILKTPKQLFKNTVIFGKYGSGKTTFFDYIYVKLSEQNIHPIYIQLGGIFEIREILLEFNKQIYEQLSRKLRIVSGNSLENYENPFDDSMMIDAFKKFNRYDINNFIVFIDDLHKGEVKKALSFVSHLQILTSKILRKLPFLDLGFFIAGHTDWEELIKYDPKYSGSVARWEKMPEISIDDAYALINKRLKAFSRNVYNPRELNKQFIINIYNDLVENEQEITIRRIIREVLNELDLGHFEALTVNPINISKKDINKIKKRIDRNTKLRKKIQYFLYGTSGLNREQKRICFSYIIKIYLNNGVYEADIKETDISYYQVLYNFGFITKVFTNKGLMWNISIELWNINKEIINIFQLSIEDYLMKIYFPTYEEKITLHEETNYEVQNIESLILVCKSININNLLTTSKDIHKEILELRNKAMNKDDANNIYNKCIKSIKSLTKAYYLYENLPIDPNEKDINILLKWDNFWYSPEIIQQFNRAIILYDGKQREIPHIVSLYKDAFTTIINFFKNEYENSNILKIPIGNLKNNEIVLLHECRDLWSDNRFSEIASKLTKYIENTIRTLLYNIFNLQFGSFENRMKMLDRQSRNYIKKNLEKDKRESYGVIQNEFIQLNRAQYKNIMTGIHGTSEGRRNWKNIFLHIFNPWNEIELDTYLDEFAKFNVRVSHLKEDTITLEQQDFVYSFMQKSIRFLKNINKFYNEIITRYGHSVNDNIYFSLNRMTDKNILTYISINEDDKKEWETYLIEKVKLKIPLDEQDYIENIISINYRKFYALLYSGYIEKSIIIENSNGSEIYISFKTLEFKN